MIHKWEDMRYWRSGEWQKIVEDFDDWDRKGIQYNPKRTEIFRALDLTPYTSTKVAIIGQDPYPNAAHATGVAFSVPKGCVDYPPTLQNIFHEYSDIHRDLKYPYPKTGCLETWCQRGVLLWNAYPTCFTGRPGSNHWSEWEFLTHEIIEELNANNILIVTLGAVARSFCDGISNTLSFSHPSPLGFKKGLRPFDNSRFFSTINDHLCGMNEEPIDWRLP